MKDFWKHFGQTALTLAPVILATTPLAPVAPIVVAAITRAQKVDEDGDGTISGAEKLRLVRDEVRMGIPIHNTLNPHWQVNGVVADSEIDHAVSLVVDASKLVARRTTPIATPTLPVDLQDYDPREKNVMDRRGLPTIR